MMCQDGHAGGPDLVGGIAVGCHPVAAHQAGLHPAVFHHHGGHVVADEGHIHPRPVQFKGSEPGALEQGPGLIGKNTEAEAPLLSQQNGAQSGAVGRCGDGSGIAVGQKALAGLEQGQAVFRDGLVPFLVLPVDGQRLFPKGGFDGGDRAILHGQCLPVHAAQGPEQVHRRGTGGRQPVTVRPEMGVKCLEPAFRGGFRPKIGAVGRRDADGRRAPDLQRPDGAANFFVGAERDIADLVGQQRLVQNDQGAVFIVQAVGDQRFKRHRDAPFVRMMGQAGGEACPPALF